MNDLIARIKNERWHMTLDYVPQIDTFIVSLNGNAWGRGETMESAIISAIDEMDGRSK